MPRRRRGGDRRFCARRAQNTNQEYSRSIRASGRQGEGQFVTALLPRSSLRIFCECAGYTVKKTNV
eukprot:8690080-Lingulodinium_polyedra.AAC.1